jgi:hypothetical protein
LLDWTAVTGATNYEVHYGTDPALNAFSTFNVTTSQVNCANLTFGATYYWKVKARSANDSSNWSVTWSFIVTDTIFLASPANNSLNLSSNQLLDWSVTGGASGYQVQWDTTSSFTSSLLQTFITGTTSQINTNNLLFGTKWFWRVRAFHAVDTTQWSAIWNFTVNDTVFLVSPANNAINAAPNELLDWSAVSGISGYQVQWDTSAAFNSTLFSSFITGTTSQTNVNNLRFGATYYWRVRAFHTADTTQWSATFAFTVTQGVNLITPANNAINQVVDVLLDWSPVSGITGYVVQTDTSPVFNSPEFSSSILGATSQFNTSSLLFGTRYYWRVKAFHAADSTQWSPVWTFTTTDTLFLVSPANGSTGQVPNVLLDWNPMSGVNGYQVQYDTSASFSSTQLVTTNIGTTSQLNANNLLFGQTYYWRVKGFHTADTSNWSVIWSFSVTDVLTQVAPANGSSFQTPDVIVDWAAIGGATGYQVYLDTNASFTSPAFVSFNISGVSQSATGNLYFGTVYHWKVRAFHAADTSDWTGVWTFRTIDSLTLVSPGNNATNQPLNITLDWAALSGINGYELQVSPDSLFTNPSSFIATSSLQSVSNLSYGTRYFWRVRAFHPNDTTSWGNIWKFETIFQITSIPVLTFPTNGTMNAPLTDTLKWGSVNDPNVNAFEIQLDDNNLFSSPVVFNTIDTITPYSNLNWNTTYYWRVRCKNGSGNGPWSTTWNFTTLLNVGLDDITTTNVIAYPNPAGIGQTIRIILPGSITGIIDIYYPDGRLFERVRMNDGGQAEVNFPNAGVYLLRWTDEDNNITGFTKLMIH